MRDILVVLTNPINDERHDEFNDWYTNIHIRDVMRMPSSIANREGDLFIAMFDEPAAYRLSAAATRAWGRTGIIETPALVAGYRPLTARLTADQVVNADPESREKEARARQAMGDKQHRLPG